MINDIVKQMVDDLIRQGYQFTFHGLSFISDPERKLIFVVPKGSQITPEMLAEADRIKANK